MSDGASIVGLGTRDDYVARAPGGAASRVALSPEEQKVLDSLGEPARIREVIQRSGLVEARAIAILLALRAKGLLVPAKVSAAPKVEELSAAMSEEVELDPERKKEILDLERTIDKLDHFAVLGLRPGTPPDEVKKAFYEASRRYHPDRYFGKNLGSFRARIDRIFRRISEAQQVLTDASRRADYLKAHPELAGGAGGPVATSSQATESFAVDSLRGAERRARLVRHPYMARSVKVGELVQKARQFLAENQPSKAYTELHLAVQIDPTHAEARRLLEETRRAAEVSRGVSELKKAEELEKGGDLPGAIAAYSTAARADPSNHAAAFRAARLMHRLGQDAREAKALAQAAVEANPKSADYRVLLGLLLADAGVKSAAKNQFEEALKLQPDHPEAKKHLRKWWPF